MSPSETSYEVIWQRDTSVGCPHADDEGSDIISTSNSYHIVGLEEDSGYIITVRAFNAEGIRNTVTVMTLEAAPSAAPTSMIVYELTSSTITVHWEMVACIHRNRDITGYSVQYTGGESREIIEDSNGRMHLISNLEPSTHYSIQVAAVNSAGTGPYSNAVEQSTAVLEPVLSTGAITAISISLSWTSGGSEDVRYEVMWRTASLDCLDVDEDRTTASSTSYIIMGLKEGIRYSIRVTTLNEVSRSVSDTITTMTLEAVPSGPPTSVRVSSTFTTITVQWEPVDCIHRNGDITGYSMQYGKESAEEDRIVEMVSGNETTITGLMPYTIYSVEVAAVNNAGTGVYSAIFNVPTEPVYLSLNGEIIPNHGYVVISDIGSTDNTALICHTNRPTTLSSSAGHHHSGGEWTAPDGTIVFLYDVPGVRDDRGPGMLRVTGTPADGIYQCVLEDSTFTEYTILVGLYYSREGNITMSDDITFTVDSDLSGVSPQFTLTCISTGGPATTVTWTRDSVTVTEGTETVLDDPVTAQYTHTLTVTGRLGGLYTCTVANSKPSSDSASYNVQGTEPPNDVLVIQASGTSILVSWRPSGNATGYIISYTGAGRSGSVTVDGGSIDNYTLTGLRNGATYIISIVATSQHFSSEAVAIGIYLGQLRVSVTSVTATSISLSWSVPSDSVVTSYEVMWREGATEMTSGSLTTTSYTIEQLESNTNYTIIVIAIYIAGSTESLPIIVLTDSNINTRLGTAIDYTVAIIGGVAVLSLSMAVIVIVVIVIALRARRGATAAQKSSREGATSSTADEVLDQSKPSEKEEEKYVDSDIIPTSTNEAYHTVRHPRETVAPYEVVTLPRTVPSHS